MRQYEVILLQLLCIFVICEISRSEECGPPMCSEPLTYPLSSPPCSCVWPMRVEICINVPIYTFFPLVYELSLEIAAGVFMKQNQVRIVGARSSDQQEDSTIVLIDLVPFGVKFNNTTANVAYERIWYKKIAIKTEHFGNYQVLSVQYPGLPHDPLQRPSGRGSHDNGSDANVLKPMGVNVRKSGKKQMVSGLINILVISSAGAFILFIGVSFTFVKYRCQNLMPVTAPKDSLPTCISPGQTSFSKFGHEASSELLPVSLSLAAYTGSVKVFSLSEIEKATNFFEKCRLIGGQTNHVYRGILESKAKVAVKVLMRHNRQMEKVFLAEAEILGHLHHRNLVKLIGVCTERYHCLVFDFIPNGSLESHLHGINNEINPLSWFSRLRIALGSARALAYLHEDSNPPVMHQNFKSSNILLEHDFTAKISDFGLSRFTMDGYDPISVHVTGSSRCAAEEYAEAGNPLVKYDVFNFGLVLLELITGRKSIDVSQVPGQENLATWSHAFFTAEKELVEMIDPALNSLHAVDSIEKVAAIASMCVHSEVLCRPSMSEIVQALKLVYDEAVIGLNHETDHDSPLQNVCNSD